MSINNSTKRKYQAAIPTIDEGWWESVLAEERQHAAHVPPNPVTKPKPAPAAVAETQETVQPENEDWEAIQDLYSNDRILTVSVTGHNRGGLLVEGNGISGFVPFSHLIELAGKEQDIDRDISLESYMGKSLQVKVIECAPEQGRVVFSERAALSAPGKRAELFQSIAAGMRVKGTVTNITDFGVFVDLGGVEGLIHISELSWGRVAHPDQIVTLGQAIEAQVLEISSERCRVALSLKRLQDNPWDRAEVNFPVDSIQPATVTSVLSYGAFARLDAGVEGLIHASEMPLGANQMPRDIFAEGQRIQVRILHLDPLHKRLGLSARLNQ